MAALFFHSFRHSTKRYIKAGLIAVPYGTDNILNVTHHQSYPVSIFKKTIDILILIYLCSAAAVFVDFMLFSHASSYNKLFFLF
jgi:hypothetical protein